MKGASVNSVYLVQNGAVLSKTLTAKVTDSKVDSLNGVSQGAKVDGDVSLTFDGISAVRMEAVPVYMVRQVRLSLEIWTLS